MEKRFESGRLNNDDALKEAQRLQEKLKEKYPEKGEDFSPDDYQVESDILDVENADQNIDNSDIPIPPELLPEVVERIMEKIQDINKPGTGFHSVRILEDDNSTIKLGGILRKGLLGKLNPNSPEQDWVSAVRKKMGAVVFFNIVGRDLRKIEDAHWFRPIGTSQTSLGIIFDTADFKENTEIANYALDYDLGKREKLQYKSNTFGAHARPGSEREEYFEEGDRRIPDYSEGYALSFRIAPDRFKGIVIRAMAEQTEEEMDNLYKKQPYVPQEVLRKIHRYKEVDDDESKQNKANEIATLMRKIYGDRVDFLLPIYDAHGNLLWPRQISYNEVREIVKEGEKNSPPKKN
ncbi:MAG: hypothetical protein WC244_00200 [Patescibacteria group bacterium]|jgi:hypothetical protein